MAIGGTNTATGFCVIQGSEVVDQPFMAQCVHNVRGYAQSLAGNVAGLKITEVNCGRTWVLIVHRDSVCQPCLRTGEGDIAIIAGATTNTLDSNDCWRAFADPANFDPRLNGSYALISIREKGAALHLWNSWCGSMPVYSNCDKNAGLTVLGTLEPLVALTLSEASSKLSKRGLVELLWIGNFIGEHTLHQGMKHVKADSYSHWRAGERVTLRCRETLADDPSVRYRTEEQILRDYDQTLHEAFDAALGHSEHWRIPLSGGLDSRLIVARAADLKKAMRVFTYDNNRNNFLSGKAVASRLHAPWTAVRLSAEEIARYSPLWLNIFGAGIHAHGMYHGPLIQKAFISDIQQMDCSCTGFLGDPINGAMFGDFTSPQNNTVESFLASFCHFWKVCPLDDVLTFDPSPYIKEIHEAVAGLVAGEDGSLWQQRLRAYIWTRQSKMIYFQTYLYNFYLPTFQPYNYLPFVQLCYNLPDKLLDKRTAQKGFLVRNYPQLAKIAGTFADDYQPLIKTRGYVLKEGIKRRVPEWLLGQSGSEWKKAARKSCNSEHASLDATTRAGLETVAAYLNPVVIQRLSTGQALQDTKMRNHLNRILPIAERVQLTNNIHTKPGAT